MGIAVAVCVENQLQVAELAAAQYAAAHPSLDWDECRGEAGLAVAKLVGKAPTSKRIQRAVENRLRALLLSSRRYAGREVACNVPVNQEDGPPLLSIWGLRAAVSLNPPADISPATAGVIRDVQASAVKQCCGDHPEHEYYEFCCEQNRNTVAVSKRRREQIAEYRRRCRQEAVAV